MGQESFHLSIRTYPDASLRVKARPVLKFTENLKDAVRKMSEIMYARGGIGLAATQVGLDSDIFLVDTGSGLVAFVNARIVERSRKKTRMEEGCLSLPGIAVNVSRPAAVRVRAQDQEGIFFEMKMEGLEAKAVQHEMDHLKGKLLLDHMNPAARYVAAKKLKKLKREAHIC